MPLLPIEDAIDRLPIDRLFARVGLLPDLLLDQLSEAKARSIEFDDSDVPVLVEVQDVKQGLHCGDLLLPLENAQQQRLELFEHDLSVFVLVDLANTL